MTQKERTMFENYLDFNATTLSDVYSSYSDRKKKAYQNCVEDCKEKNGKEPRIPTFSRFQFTFAFQYSGLNGEPRLRYHTASNVYDFEIEGF